jgi:hypothetical protein
MNIDPLMLEEIFKLTGEPTRGDAVNRVMADWIRQRKIDELRKMIGSLHLDYDWEAEEKRELADMRKHRS